MSLLSEILEKCYDIKSLPSGGQKDVCYGIHPEYGPIVIKSGSYRYATSLDRITREVNFLRSIDSKYFPKNYEFLIDTKRYEFVIVEEYLDANELTNVRDRFDTDEKILSLLGELICGLQVIWSQRVVHRDIKPANILITNKNEPRIIDLGIARFLDKTSLTETIAKSGPRTPIYASPEQIKNKKSMINVRTDFFLLGLLTLELLLNHHPFDPAYVGNQKNIIENILDGNYVDPGDGFNPILVGFIRTSLKTKPYERFRTVKDVKHFLDLGC